MKIFVINGLPRSGKDTFVEFCKKHSCWCLNVSTVDFVKEIATHAGWDGTKTPTNRAFLSSLKDLLTLWNDVPFKKVCKSIEYFKREMEAYDFDPNTEGVVFIHCREPQEIDRFRVELGSQSILLTRGAVEGEKQSNHADANVNNYQYDYIIANAGSLLDLEETAIRFLEAIDLKNLK